MAGSWLNERDRRSFRAAPIVNRVPDRSRPPSRPSVEDYGITLPVNAGPIANLARLTEGLRGLAPPRSRSGSGITLALDLAARAVAASPAGAVARRRTARTLACTLLSDSWHDLDHGQSRIVSTRLKPPRNERPGRPTRRPTTAGRTSASEPPVDGTRVRTPRGLSTGRACDHPRRHEGRPERSSLAKRPSMVCDGLSGRKGATGSLPHRGTRPVRTGPKARAPSQSDACITRFQRT